MSSPSSAGKRKRSASHHLPASVPKSSTAELLQPSSRDASGEEGDDSTGPSSLPPSGSTRHRKQDNHHNHHHPTTNPSNGAASSGVPPSKRARKGSIDTTTSTSSSSRKNNNNSNNNHNHVSTNGTSSGRVGPGGTGTKAEDPGEPSETTVASSDIENGRLGLQIKTAEGGEERDGRIQPPQRGGLLDPVGYHTNPPPVGRPVRVYADGVFDLFHLGHMRQLEQAKKAFPDVYLMVGVTGDDETHQRKGLTVLSGAERAETLRHCKWVDEVVPNCPWIVTPEFIEEHQVDYVAHDDLPYGAAEGDDIYAPIKARGQFLVTQRTEGVSTTGIISRIVRDYDQYISRQFKRGASRQELNVSWLKKNELEIKRHVTDLRDNIRNNWTATGQELGRELRQFWQNSRPNSPAPSARNSIDLGGSGRSSGLVSPTAGRNEDFATGYSLGLIGGVRAWMARSRRSLIEQPSGPHSPSSEEDQDQDPVSEHSHLHPDTPTHATRSHAA